MPLIPQNKSGWRFLLLYILIGALKVEMAKLQVKHRLDMRAQLTDEQRMKFDASREKMKRGGGHGRMMQKMHEGME